MGMKVKSCFLSLAVLVAAAARADESTSAPRQDDSAYLGTNGSTHGQNATSDGYAASAKDEAASGARMDAAKDEAADAGSGSREPKHRTDSDFSQQEFLRNVWSTP